MASDITSGVEFEFAYPTTSFPSHLIPPSADDEHEFAARHAVEWLQSTTSLPIAIVCMCDTRYDDFSQVCKEAPEQNHHIDEFTIIRGPPGSNAANLTSADCYFVQCDSVVPPGSSGWCGLEIATPVKPLSSLRQRPSDLQRFLGHIRNWNADVAVTPLCGLHVHVGQSGDGITLETAKRMVTLVALLEVPLLMKLVSPERTDSKFFCPITYLSVLMNRITLAQLQADANLSNVLPTGFDTLKYWASNGGRLGPFISHIWQCQSLREIKDALKRYDTSGKCSLELKLRYPADNDGGILQPDPRKCSFEFRYPQGSFCEDFVEMWVSITTCIMAICRENNPVTYRNVLTNVFRALEKGQGQDDGIPDLLHALGLGGRVNNWTQLLDEIHDGQDRSLVGNGEFRRLRRYVAPSGS
jgi:hypothetical protein